MRTICIITFGCQMNKLDSTLAAEALADAGHLVVEDETRADTIVFNTCSVREHAEDRVLSRLAQLKPRRLADPDFRLGIMGCFAEKDGRELLEKLPYLDFALGTRAFTKLPEALAELEGGSDAGAKNSGRKNPGKIGLFGGDGDGQPGIDSAHPRERHQGIHGYVSVMRGCDNRCSYCIVPSVRGGEISRPPEAIGHEVRALALAGAKEVTLLGQNIDAYGKHNGYSLARLLRDIDLAAPPESGLRRIRFVTSHPRDITRELVETVAALPRVCRHFHMPAQSGSSAILKAMGRGYDRAEYDRKIALIREIIPDAGIASDFIVGFPGESHADYLATRDLVETAAFTNSYIFKYSPRPGTRSARELPDDVPLSEKKRRNNDLLAVQNRVNAARGDSLIGRRVEIMIEGVSARDRSRWTGRTGDNLICVFPAPTDAGDREWPGKIATVTIEAATALTLYGQLVPL